MHSSPVDGSCESSTDAPASAEAPRPCSGEKSNTRSRPALRKASTPRRPSAVRTWLLVSNARRLPRRGTWRAGSSNNLSMPFFKRLEEGAIYAAPNGGMVNCCQMLRFHKLYCLKRVSKGNLYTLVGKQVLRRKREGHAPATAKIQSISTV